MANADSNKTPPIARLRERECEIEAVAFKKRLNFLWWPNWATIVLPSMLSAFAGAAVFASSTTGINWKIWTGGAALLSALLVAIHKGLNCDAYQAECRRLVQAYSGLATRYRTLHQVDVDGAKEKLLELDAALAAIRETATVDAPDVYRGEARGIEDANCELES